MSNFNTELYKALASDSSIDEIVRSEIESCLNFLLKTELTNFLDYEPYDTNGYNTAIPEMDTMLVPSRPAMVISRFKYQEIAMVNSNSKQSSLINGIRMIWKQRSCSFIPKELPLQKSVIGSKRCMVMPIHRQRSQISPEL